MTREKFIIEHGDHYEIFDHDHPDFYRKPTSDRIKRVSYMESAIDPEGHMKRYEYIVALGLKDQDAYQEVKRLTSDLMKEIAELKRERDMYKRIANEYDDYER